MDRLLFAGINIPLAYFERQKALIDARTRTLVEIEGKLGHAVASSVQNDHTIIENAQQFLIQKEFRKQLNREAVAQAALENLSSTGKSHEPQHEGEDLDADWLNIFEKHVEDASTERMQNLWGRVLAGKIKTPGQYSLRTLRFLSELSQKDAEIFQEFSDFMFNDFMPRKIFLGPDGLTGKNLKSLSHLESLGLIQGAL